ncbi:hypothetical protein DO97_03620 [Neosynechococcus sphagnicola sy1]|uniref:Uncharacterized protein n=1 Tax=Neosynechococcus sphagnicola sy1 TaxID=1497020 RepID=A0A098TKH1_9CYAN|nr:hypothetical protein DO97_03620 [Neosynechococcus sphagnicola sy1]
MEADVLTTLDSSNPMIGYGRHQSGKLAHERKLAHPQRSVMILGLMSCQQLPFIPPKALF